MKGFLAAGGSVPGYQHTKPGQPGWTNNQDAFAIRQGPDYLVAVVCDGCSSTPHAEVGALLGAQIIAAKCVEALTNPHLQVHLDKRIVGQKRIEAAIHWAQEFGSLDLQGMAAHMTNGWDEVEQYLHDYFLFTAVGTIVTPEETGIFALGDGVYALNGVVSQIGPYEGNAPPYLAYRRMPSLKYKGNLDFEVKEYLPTAECASLLIGTDGVAELIGSEVQLLPGLNTPVGPLSQFWTDQKFVQNPDAIRRRLAQANRERVEDGQIKHGLLSDDTTLVVIQREKGAN